MKIVTRFFFGTNKLILKSLVQRNIEITNTILSIVFLCSEDFEINKIVPEQKSSIIKILRFYRYVPEFIFFWKLRCWLPLLPVPCSVPSSLLKMRELVGESCVITTKEWEGMHNSQKSKDFPFTMEFMSKMKFSSWSAMQWRLK